MKLYNNYIKIKTKQTGGTGFSATGGKWKKINKTSENTKFNIW